MGEWNCICKVINNELCLYVLVSLSSFSESGIKGNHTASRARWERASSPAGAMGLTACGEILDPSEINSLLQCGICDCWLWVYSPLFSVLRVKIHPSPTDLIKNLENGATALRNFWKTLRNAGNLECSWQSPTTDSLWGSFLGGLFCFQVGFLAYCCLCSPGLLVSGWEHS